MASRTDDLAPVSKSLRRATTFRHGAPVVSVAFSGDGQLLATAGNDYTIKIWHVAKRRHIRTLHFHEAPPLERWQGRVLFTEECRLLAWTTTGGPVKAWNVQGMLGFLGRLQRVAPPTVLIDLSLTPCEIWQMILAPTGEWLSAGYWDEALDVRRIGERPVSLAPGVPGQSVKQHTRGRMPVAFSQDGSRLLAAEWMDEHSVTLKVWDVTARQPLCEFRADTETAALSPDGNRMVLKCVAPVQAGDLTLDGGRMTPDEYAGLLANAESYSVIDVVSREAVYVLPVQPHADNEGWLTEALTFSPDSRVLATGTEQGIVWLWDTAKPELTGKMLVDGQMGHTAPIRALAFSPSGDLLATGGDDGMVQVWALADVIAAAAEPAEPAAAELEPTNELDATGEAGEVVEMPAGDGDTDDTAGAQLLVSAVEPIAVAAVVPPVQAARGVQDAGASEQVMEEATLTDDDDWIT